VAALKPGRFLLRPPDWAARDAVKLTRNGAEQRVEWGGPDKAYVVCPDARFGDVYRLAWPVPAFRQTFVPTSVEGRGDPLTFDWVGNQVVKVEPCGRHLVMFGNGSGR